MTTTTPSAAPEPVQLALVAQTPAANTPPAPAPAPAPAAFAFDRKPSIVAPTHPVPDSVDKTLVEILSWPRQHETNNERLFVAWLRKRLYEAGHTITSHSEGAISVTLPIKLANDAMAASTTLFSSHVDTCDRGAIELGARKKLLYDANFGDITLDTGSVGSCLGADDGVGVWLMLKMIEAEVPGTYLFHRGEECGGISAKAIARLEGPWLKQFEAAIAFDRPNSYEVITHQGGAECASDKYAKALCVALNENGMAYEPSSRGVYTDTKEYRKVIAECINIGVGYHSQHGMSETQDYAHLSALLKAVLTINWEALPVDRDPSKAVEYSYGGGYRGYGDYAGYGHGGRQTLFRDGDDEGGTEGDAGYEAWKAKWDRQREQANRAQPTTPPAAKAKVPKKRKGVKPGYGQGQEHLDALNSATSAELYDLVTADTDAAHMALITLLRENARLRADVRMLNTFIGC